MQGPTLETVKYQVVRLMRMLVEITQTLEKVGTWGGGSGKREC